MSGTLADRIIRETYRARKAELAMQEFSPSLSSLVAIRRSIQGAHRFVLDPAMSGFLADLSQVPFMTAPIRRNETLDSMRHGALLPFPSVWVEYDAYAFRRRLMELNPDQQDAWGKQLAEPDGSPDMVIPLRWAWLLVQHPDNASVITQYGFVEWSSPDASKFRGAMLSFKVLWNCKDEPTPEGDPYAGMMAHGVTPYACKSITVVNLRQPPEDQLAPIVMPDRSIHKVDFLIPEFGGLVRYAMAFLSTINDVPVIRHAAKDFHQGYFAKGQYRRYVDHTVIKLNIPGRTNTKILARRVFAMARKRWHKVRAHWRLYQREPGPLCMTADDHLWSETDNRGHAYCTNPSCSAWRTWITLPKGRGDRSLGIVKHDYEVTHDPV